MAEKKPTAAEIKAQEAEAKAEAEKLAQEAEAKAEAEKLAQEAEAKAEAENNPEPETLESVDREISEIDKEIDSLKIKKQELIKKRLSLVKNVKEVPLNQLNLISRIGKEKAKKQLGKNWVE